MISYNEQVCGQVLYELDVSYEIVKSSKEILNSSDELSEFLSSPTFDKKDKYRIVDKLFPKEITSFLKVMTDIGMSRCLDEIFDAYENIRFDRLDVVRGELTGANEISDEFKEKFALSLKARYNASDVILKTSIDPSLMGGYTLKIGDIVYDNSVKGALEALSRKLTGNIPQKF